VRLLTLWGERGVGKTALAKAVAAHLWRRRLLDDGVAFVELADVRTEAAALGGLGEALDMEFSKWKDVSRALQRWQGLVVLDGLDELLESAPAAAERLVAALLAASQLQVLATSVRPLSAAIGGGGVPAEHPVHLHCHSDCYCCMFRLLFHLHSYSYCHCYCCSYYYSYYYSYSYSCDYVRSPVAIMTIILMSQVHLPLLLLLL
jgi:hypothetical protein